MLDILVPIATPEHIEPQWVLKSETTRLLFLARLNAIELLLEEDDLSHVVYAYKFEPDDTLYIHPMLYGLDEESRYVEELSGIMSENPKAEIHVVHARAN